MANTPMQIMDAVSEFCRSIRADQQPEYLPVNSIADDGVRDCYGNVAKKIAADGGNILYGWAIWLEPDKFIEAEHHAVWVAPDGHRECVSHQSDTDKILFLPDPENVHQNALIPNRRKSLTNDPRMAQFIALAEQHDKLRQKHAVFNEDGTLKGCEHTREMMYIEAKMAELQIGLGMLNISEDEMMQALRGLSFEPKPRVNLTPSQRAAMMSDHQPTRSNKPMTPKERVAAWEKQKREKRAKK